MTLEKQQILLNVRGQDPLVANPPLFSNFVQISRLGTDVQFEFIFLDLNQMAQLADKMKKEGVQGPQEVVGVTAAKVVVNGLAFIQVRDHLNTIFDALAKELNLPEVKNESDARQSSVTGVR